MSVHCRSVQRLPIGSEPFHLLGDDATISMFDTNSLTHTDLLCARAHTGITPGISKKRRTDESIPNAQGATVNGARAASPEVEQLPPPTDPEKFLHFVSLYLRNRGQNMTAKKLCENGPPRIRDQAVNLCELFHQVAVKGGLPKMNTLRTWKTVLQVCYALSCSRTLSGGRGRASKMNALRTWKKWRRYYVHFHVEDLYKKDTSWIPVSESCAKTSHIVLQEGVEKFGAQNRMLECSAHDYLCCVCNIFLLLPQDFVAASPQRRGILSGESMESNIAMLIIH